MTDKQLQGEVLAELEFEPAVNAVHVGVSVDQGVVTLTGYVDSYGEKLAAERAARRVYSAKAVANDLEVKLPSRDEVPDSALARAAVQALQDCVQVPRDAVRITVRDGHLYLEGKVDWQFQKSAAEEAVRHLRGVRGVANHLEVRPQVSTNDVKGQIERALRRSAEIEASHIHVETVEGTVILRGHVHSWHEQEEAVLAAWRAPGVTCVEDQLVLQP